MSCACFQLHDKRNIECTCLTRWENVLETNYVWNYSTDNCICIVIVFSGHLFFFLSINFENLLHKLQTLQFFMGWKSLRLQLLQITAQLRYCHFKTWFNRPSRDTPVQAHRQTDVLKRTESITEAPEFRQWLRSTCAKKGRGPLYSLWNGIRGTTP